MLFIMGLMLSAFLKGQEFINNVKVKSLAADFNNISVFMNEYQDKYRALPGDDSKAVSHLGASVSAPVGDGDNLILGLWVNYLFQPQRPSLSSFGTMLAWLICPME